MKKTQPQSAMQALEIFIKAQQEGKEVRVSKETGYVREATKFDQFISILEKNFGKEENYSELWRSKALIAICNKLANDCRLIDGGMNHFEAGYIATSFFSRPDVFEAKNKTIKEFTAEFGENLALSESAKAALKNIKAIHGKNINPNEYFFNETIKRQKNLDLAIAVAEHAKSLKKTLKLPDKYLFHLSYHAQILYKKYNISAEQSIQAIQLSDHLVTQHKLNESDALVFAIDLLKSQKSLNISANTITKTSRFLFPEDSVHKNISEKTKISAAIAYFQLRNEGEKSKNSIEIIKKRIGNLKLINNILPRGCNTEFIHQGAHIRGKYELNQSELQKFRNDLRNINVDSMIKPERGLTEKFTPMNPQFGKDIQRINYQFLRNGKPEPDLRSLVTNDPTLNIGNTEAEKSQWAETFINYAGGENSATRLSAFTSQTIFGDVRINTATSNTENLSVQFTGNNLTDNFQFMIDQTEVNQSKKTIVRATQLINAVKMISAPLNDQMDSFLPPPSTIIDLIPNAGDGKRATQKAFTAKYEFEVELDSENLRNDIIDCTPKKVTAEFNLILDQKKIDEYFNSIETI